MEGGYMQVGRVRAQHRGSPVRHRGFAVPRSPEPNRPPRHPDEAEPFTPVALAHSADAVLLAVMAGSALPVGLLVAAVFGGGAVMVGVAFVAEVLVTAALVAAIGRAVGPTSAAR
jgi:hypothetical protein